jgi:hypothetical protein
VVIDVATSTIHFDQRFVGWLNSFHDTEYDLEQKPPNMMPPIDSTDHVRLDDNSDNEKSLLICRGYLPAYLASSSVYAVGVLISGLRQPEPIWGSKLKLSLTALRVVLRLTPNCS